MLEAQDLACERSGRLLFRALSFSVGTGQVLRIAGANGSGKTSLLRILCGLLPPTQGAVLWNGSSVARMGEEYSQKLVYLGHAAAVKDELTAVENLAIACRLAGTPSSEADAENALGRLGLEETKTPVKRLSQGQRRRAALARLVLSEERPLWLLDEPFAALDVDGVAVLTLLMKGHIARGGAIAFTTHQETGIPATRVVELG